jgi:hypothetical protein
MHVPIWAKRKQDGADRDKSVCTCRLDSQTSANRQLIERDSLDVLQEPLRRRKVREHVP